MHLAILGGLGGVWAGGVLHSAIGLLSNLYSIIETEKIPKALQMQQQEVPLPHRQPQSPLVFMLWEQSEWGRAIGGAGCLLHLATRQALKSLTETSLQPG